MSTAPNGIPQDVWDSQNQTGAYTPGGSQNNGPQTDYGYVVGPAPTPTSTYVDPYASYGGTDAYNRLVSGFNEQKSNIYGSADAAAKNAGIGYRGSILDLVESLRRGQNAIDEQGVQNELAKRQGYYGVLGMVGRGLKQGGVLLANKNAGDSSASEGIARAYSDIGRRNLSQVGNQYEQGLRGIGLAQEDLGVQRESGIRHLQDSKTQIINNIVSDARDKLAALDAAMAEANVPDKINIQQEKDKIKAQVVDALQQYDDLLSQKTEAINPTSIEDRRGQAFNLANAGTAPENAFSYTSQVPAQFANSGPFSSELPIFRKPPTKQEV